MKTLVYSNLFIALCAAILSLGTYGMIDLLPNPFLILHIFGVTLVAYNVQRLIRLAKFSNRTDQIRWYLEHKWMLYTALFIGLVVSVYTFLNLPFGLLLTFAPLAVLSLLYSIAFIPLAGRKMAIRDLPGAKIFIIALVWTGVTLILPMREANHVFDSQSFLWIVQRFSFILAITIPFDIRDLKFDALELKTIPQLMGSLKAKRLALLFVVLCIAIEFIMYIGFQEPGLVFSLRLIAYLLVFTAVHLSGAKRRDLYYSGLLDGTMLFLGFILMC